MGTTRLSSKGQIVIPLNIRAARSWVSGAEFDVEETPEGILLRPVSRFPETSLDAVAGCLKSGRKPKTLAQMQAAIDREVRRRRDGGRY